MNKEKFDLLFDTIKSLDDMESMLSCLLESNVDERLRLFLPMFDFDGLRNKVVLLVQDAGG